ncbi:MAG: NAD(P)-dependent glycerol-3-phosphate dehydrogenase [Brevinematales bacterium]|nr:NAD(P)-dependent glycerol-3-phosphate dehydrogenase [Brevinematales bacterium]
MKVSVIGAGGWGTALAIQASLKNEVSLWVYSKEELDLILKERINTIYLPDVKIPGNIVITNDVEKVSKCDIMLFVVPSKYFRNVVKTFSNYIKKDQILVSATKGLEFLTKKRMSEILLEETNSKNIAVISGPSHAEEVARNVPTSIVAASKNEKIAKTVQDTFSTESLRLYRHNDMVGVELAGAFKNVIAIAAGMLRGFGLGDNTMAALITRGLAEIRRLGIKMGGKLETFAGLAGIGDLIVTCMSKYSRNGRVGEMLARGQRIEEILASMKMVAEGVETAKSIPELEARYGIELPISNAVYEVIYQNMPPEVCLRNLMKRPLKHEYV